MGDMSACRITGSCQFQGLKHLFIGFDLFEFRGHLFNIWTIAADRQTDLPIFLFTGLNDGDQTTDTAVHDPFYYPSGFLHVNNRTFLLYPIRGALPPPGYLFCFPVIFCEIYEKREPVNIKKTTFI